MKISPKKQQTVYRFFKKNILKETSYMFCGLGLDIKINIKISQNHLKVFNALNIVS